MPATSPCSLRLNPTTNARGGVYSEEPCANNKYNQNFRNRFCACECYYDPFQQKGTMFQCLGLGTHETGGCGEDWYHPGCIVGLGPRWFEKMEGKKVQKSVAAEGSVLPVISEDAEAAANGGAAQNNDNEDGSEDDDDLPNPPGFPKEDEFETFICFKCVEAHPWIKRYAGTPGFLLPVHRKAEGDAEQQPLSDSQTSDSRSTKRKAGDGEMEDSQDSKRLKNENETADNLEAKVAVDTDPETKAEDEAAPEDIKSNRCNYEALPAAPQGTFSIFCAESFRDRFCRCEKCFPDLAPHAQLLEEEEIYEPPISEDGGSENGGSTHGSGSLYERGESALRNVDRVRAIEGVMAYNQLKDKLKPFFQQFADSGKAIGADDIKEYFAKLRGDEEAIKEAGESAKTDHRQDQPGY